MAEFREQPYSNFNFLVDLGTGDTDSPQAGFIEISLPDAEIDIIEYRNGNEKDNSPRLIPGLVHYGNITLKRGVIGALDLYQWFDQVRDGDPGARRTVLIRLLNEDRTTTALTWRLQNALPARYSFGALNAKSHEVAVEYLELAFERLDME